MALTTILPSALNATQTFSMANLVVAGNITAGNISGAASGLTSIPAANITGSLSSVTDISASGNVTLSGGTANGVAYLNSSKVLTSGSALTFTGTNLGIGADSPGSRLVVRDAGATGTSQFSNLLAQFVANAANADCSIQLSNGVDNSARMGIVGGANLYWSQNGVERMRIASNGNVGIGTTLPNGKLDVAGTTAFNWVAGGSTTALAVIGSQGTAGGSLFVNTASLSTSFASGLAVDGTYTNPGGIGTSIINLKAVGVSSGGGYGSAIAFHTSIGSTLTERMRIDSLGNLGLGTTPSPWVNTRRAIDVGTTGAFFVGGGTTHVYNNAYSDGTNFIYKTTSTATGYELSSTGIHRWLIAPSGTAGNAISFTQAMTLTASGNLGIGTTDTSGYRLAVKNGAKSLYFTTDAATGFCYTDGNYYFGTTGADNVVVVANNNERMRIASDGRVAIGTTATTAAKFTVAGGHSDTTLRLTSTGNGGTGSNGPANLCLWASEPGVSYPGTGIGANVNEFPIYGRVDTTNGQSYLRFDPSNIVFYTGTGNGIERMRILNDGKVGIGTATSDGGLLTLAGAAGFVGTGFTIIENSTGSARRLRVSQDANAVTYNATWSSGDPNRHVWQVGNIEYMRLDANFLMVGTTSPSLSNSRSFITNLSEGAIAVQHSDTNTSGAVYVYFAYNGSSIGTITQNGTTGVLYNTSSDYRLKNITGPVANSGAYIDSLNPVEGTWKADGSAFVGLIAHEVQEVSRTQIATGEKDGAEMQAMDYSAAEIIANLIAEVKSLRRRLAAAGL